VTAPVRPALPALPVLVVDDNVVNRRILVEQLRRWSLQPTAVESGSAALETMRAAAREGTPFKLVLLDANMPEIDGFEVAEQIGHQPELAGATVMMLTSSGEHGDTARCRQLGIAAYLVKPVRPTDLFEAIGRALDARRPVASHSAGSAMPVVKPARRRTRVLLAEDNLVNQRVAVRLLTKRGHEVTVAANGREALAALERGTFDLVLMDVQMPEMGGFEATAEIRRREQERGGHLRIVAMTAHALKGDRERCLAAGMDGYLKKPIDRLELFEAVEQIDPSAGLQADTPGPKGRFDFADALRRFDGDTALLHDLMQLFSEDAPNRMAAIRDAVDRRDPEALRLAAHELKGAAGNLAAASVVDAARTLEILGRHQSLDAVPGAWRRLETEMDGLLTEIERVATAGASEAR
jgi:CheY-like chemotaxis protein